MENETFNFVAAGRTFTAVVTYPAGPDAVVTVNVDGQDIEFRADDEAEMRAVNPGNADPELLRVIGKAILEY